LSSAWLCKYQQLKHRKFFVFARATEFNEIYTIIKVIHSSECEGLEVASVVLVLLLLASSTKKSLFKSTFIPRVMEG
jgi:hypothetical protein